MSSDWFSAAAGPREFGRLYPPRPEWLALQSNEPVLEPNLSITDPHFHFLDLPGFRYMAEDWHADLSSGHRIEATVYAEAQTGYYKEGPMALRPVGETDFVVQETLGRFPMATGIVGFADLMLGAAVEETLLAHLEAGCGRFKGIRYSLAADPNREIGVHYKAPQDVFSSEKFHDGLRALSRLGLSFDAWAFFHQQANIAALAHEHPDLTIICCHSGGLLGFGPYRGRATEVFDTWRANMAQLARCGNVSVKLGGMLGKLAAYDYLNSPAPEPSEALAACLRPYILTLIDLFGPKRCMFESNYPVDTVATSYRGLWNIFKRITHDFSCDDKAELYSGTARRTYRLELESA